MLQIALKELKDLLYSPKFLVLAFASFILITMGIFNGYVSYKERYKESVRIIQEGEEELKERTNYEYLYPSAPRFPEKLSIFDIGVSNYTSSKAWINSSEQRLGTSGKLNEYPILAVFRELDLTFITTTILSLFAILFSYNLVSGEKEGGTLKLIMANSTRRTSIIVGKLIGGFVPLALVFIIPLLLSLVVLMFLTDINFSSEEWIRIGLMASTFLFCLLVFFTIGLAASSFSKSSIFSFIVALFFWVLFVGIVPKASIQLASVIKPAMTTSELYEKRYQYWENNRNSHALTMQKYLEKNPITEKEWKEKRGDVWDKIWKIEEKREKEYSDKIYAEFDRTKKVLINTAAFITRFSPASCTSYAAHTIANTGPNMIYNFQDNLKAYAGSFYQWADDRQKAWKAAGGKWPRPYDKTTDESGFIKLTWNDIEEKELDLAGMPEFENTPVPIENVVDEAITYIANLLFYALLFFAIAYVAFLKYDVR
jgi:ABC-type transport system involved in multi-copper enzyme maturation permease subunit